MYFVRTAGLKLRKIEIMEALEREAEALMLYEYKAVKSF